MEVETAAGFPDRDRIEDRGLKNDGRGRGGCRRRFTAHDAADRDGLPVVGDHQMVG